MTRVKERSEKADLKLNTEKALEHGIWSHHFKENTWEKAEAVTDFIFLGSKMTVDGECSHEIKICLLLGRKAMTRLDSVLKSSNIILPAKAHIIEALVFPVVMHKCENWIIKNAEH